MRTLLVVSLILSLSGAVFAADSSAQQDKAKACKAQAAGKSGDELKTFMKQCLSSGVDTAAVKSEGQDKIKSCQAGASGKTGAELKAYLKQCSGK
ncbi:MAG: PsiF family protein [Undibacterium umbellatum]|uniref:PsiF family protein n=1 Tax=Undibacterium umbellatum TaxID=2762300 RepID=UPI003BB5358F